MRKVIVIALVMSIVNLGYSQSEKVDNGYNLKSYCDPVDCKYFKFENHIIYPQESGADWEMSNTEVAIKHSGTYLLTGDMYVHGEEMGARLQFEIDFFDANDEVIYTAQTSLLEYYSEPNYAEPIVINGDIPLEIAQNMSYINFLVVESQNVPYYELTTDCYGPCNNYQLNVSIKAFKKSK